MTIAPVPNKWIAVKMDATLYFTDKDFIKKCGGKIHAVYVFNENEHTYCCEGTPSYWLICVDYVPEQTDPNDPEEVYQQLMDCHHDEADGYYHCSMIDPLPDDDKYVIPHRGWMNEDMSKDDAIEEYHANPKW